MSMDLMGLLTALMTIVSVVIGVWARRAQARIKITEDRQSHHKQLEDERAQQYDEVLAEVRRLRDEKLASMQSALDEMRADNKKLRVGLDALEAARTQDMEQHESDRRQWLADKVRLEAEMTQMRQDLGAANARIRDLEISNAKLEVTNAALVENNDLLASMVHEWNGSLPEFIRLLKAFQRDTPATMGE